MSISQPNFLMVFNETSGKNVTNYGTNVGLFAIAAQATENTDFAWHPGAGIYANDGYLEPLTAVGAHEPYLSTAATGPGSTITVMNFAVGFRIHSGTAISGTFTFFCTPGSSTSVGDVQLSAISPAGSGNFDLHCQVNNTGGANPIIFTDVTALLFDTDYIVSVSIDPTTVSATVGLLKFGSNTTQTPTSVNWTSFALDSAWPLIMRRSDFTNYFAMNGRLYFWAYQRGSTAWNSTDLAAINSNPATAIPGWPSGGGGSTATCAWWKA